MRPVEGAAAMDRAGRDRQVSRVIILEGLANVLVLALKALAWPDMAPARRPDPPELREPCAWDWACMLRRWAAAASCRPMPKSTRFITICACPWGCMPPPIRPKLIHGWPSFVMKAGMIVWNGSLPGA